MSTSTQSSSRIPQEMTPQEKALHNAVFRSMKRTRDMFFYNYEDFPQIDEKV